MSIRIPSKNIYKPQNSKIIDNVIEQIEVHAKQVVPKNDYGTAVNTMKIDAEQSAGTTIASDFKIENKVAFVSKVQNQWSATYLSGFAQLSSYKTIRRYINIPKFYNGIFISNVKTGQDIKYILSGKITTYNASATWDASINVNEETLTVSPNFSNLNITDGKEERTKFSIPDKIDVTIYNSDNSVSVQLILPSPLKSELPYSYTDQNKNYALGEINIVVACRQTLLKGEGRINSFDYDFPNISSINMTGAVSDFVAETLEITFYGDTLSIDLTDTTEYINGETTKKVHSFDGNELMQTSNYIVGENDEKINAIQEMYGRTQKLYRNGKETATLLCSISDYYDYTTQEKAISLENDNLPMVFDIGDKVIPMVFGSNLEDQPMSLYQDGTAKVFQVIGTNIIYDGAVWQELTLQELTN